MDSSEQPERFTRRNILKTAALATAGILLPGACAQSVDHSCATKDALGTDGKNAAGSEHHRESESMKETARVSNKIDGYRGIWFTLGQFSEYGDKYSGGLGTYTGYHVPLAIYAPEAKKTFFVYGGTTQADQRHLLAMASYYDHKRGVVPRPTIVHDKQDVVDPHDNPSIALDEQGHIWVFVSGRGRHRPGFKYRSVEPYCVDAFEQISEEEFTYPQPWWVEGQGFIHLFTKYTGVRELYWNTSRNGRVWTPDRKLSGIGGKQHGHYQLSCVRKGKVMTAFSMHPEGNVDKRTNLYYVETDDMGETWRAADGTVMETPLSEIHNPALIHDYMADKRLVYVSDMSFDKKGRPVILVVTSADHKPGPGGDPRVWTLAHWTGKEWELAEVARSTHNYDTGSLHTEDDNLWRIIGPTEPGPQYHGAGGEMALWISKDQGRGWSKERDITANSPRNHTYARRPINAHPDFYAFWADGNTDEFSESRLYFTNCSGDKVWRLPYDMRRDFEEPALL